MFEVPGSQVNLMNEYKSLIIKRINGEKKNNRSFVTEKDILKAIPPLSKEKLMDMAGEIKLPVFCDDYFSDVEAKILKDFIESRIGEDFVVLKRLENQVFCLHTVEDYVSEYLFLEKENKSIKLVRINEEKRVA